MPVTCEWLFKVKRMESDGEDPHKAKLVACADYAETYFLIAWTPLDDEQRMAIHQIDVKTVFLNRHLDENIYMIQLEGSQRDKQLLCQLNRWLNGLKHTSRA